MWMIKDICLIGCIGMTEIYRNVSYSGKYGHTIKNPTNICSLSFNLYLIFM